MREEVGEDLLLLAPPGTCDHSNSELTTLAWLIRDGHADGAAIEAVAARAPFEGDNALIAVRRGYAELAGRL